MNLAFSPEPSPRRRVLYVTDFHEEEMLLGIADFARKANWELISNMRFHGAFPTESEADGLLVTCYSDRVKDWLKAWKGTPTVHLGIPHPEMNLPFVQPDLELVGRTGARHLMNLGRVQHAFYSLQPGPDSRLIRDAFERELAASGLSSDRLEVSSATGGSPAKNVRLPLLAQQLKLLRKPVAIMTCDDRRSLDLLEACDMLGLRVPEDVAILGCEDRKVEVNLARVALSSVDFDKHYMGKRAAQMLQTAMDGQRLPRHCELVAPAGVKQRASTATYSTPDSHLRRSVLFIRRHYSEPLRLSSLARMAGMSERVFRDEFKRCVGHGPKEEIIRVRLDAACRLLRDTDYKLEAIAMESGFGSAKKLCEAFSRVHQTTPGRWRELAQAGKLSTAEN
ncbi:LacI family transcriptional regulator [Haloferula luteola]|uniref:LacI family transcriptional regulator n=1 Tax=Haloferula luteola TaxID=595692 RepID=A0A840VIE0_9BACT|nr:substrate-binding domain-containing protein [Haloferula luteola]MBB5352471.1 LacI family transcriptional regulator [Haloferula luteola]